MSATVAGITTIARFSRRRKRGNWKMFDEVETPKLTDTQKEELVNLFKKKCDYFKLSSGPLMEIFKKQLDKGCIRTERDVLVRVSAFKRQIEYFEGKSQADRLVEYGSKAYLFLDQYGTEHARVFLPKIPNATNATNGECTPTGLVSNIITPKIHNIKQVSVSSVSSVRDRALILSLKDKKFEQWLAGEMHGVEGKVPGKGALQSAINVLQNKANRLNNTHRLYNRVAPDPDGNGIWLDMTDKNWRAIHVTEEGWSIVDNPPILFKRFKHQKPLPEPITPEKGKEIQTVKKLLNFLNLRTRNDKIMYLCSIISYFVPEIEHPIMCVAGDTGSAKTMLFECAKRILDPSAHQTIRMADKPNELVQQLYHSYFCCFDNVTFLKQWQSDILCRAVTGAGQSKRELFSDDEDVIYQYMRCVNLNGINVTVKKSDLMNRTVLFKLKRIADIELRKRTELLTEFDEVKADILGAILSILSEALKHEKEVKLVSYKRLTDFHHWGCAIANALNFGANTFNKIYERKYEIQDEEVLDTSLTATALIGYIKEHFDEAKYGSEEEDGSQTVIFEFTPTELYKKVTEFARGSGISTSKGYWAGDASHFIQRINEVKTNLERVGISIIHYHTGVKKVVIIEISEFLKKLPKEPKSEDPDDSFWDKATRGKVQGGDN